MKKIKLGDVAEYINGYAFKPTDWSENGYTIIRIQDLTGSDYQTNKFNGEIDSKYEVNNGDILISWSATLGIYVWNKGKAYLNQHIFKVVLNTEIVDKWYFYYQVDNLLKRAQSEAHGATMKHLTKEVFNNLPFLLPSLLEQKYIAKLLGRLDELIDKRKQQLENLDKLIKSQFIEMFGDPASNPYGWEVVTIGDVVTEVRYGTSNPAVEGGQYPYLRMNNITYDGHLDLSDMKYIDISDDEIEKYIVRKGDVLFNRTNSVELVGKTCLFDLDDPMVIAGYIIRIRLNNRLLPIVLSNYLNSNRIKDRLRSMAKGAVNQANINAKELQSIKVYLPPIDRQNKFSHFVEQTDKSKFTIKQSLEQLEILKKSLMQKYFG